MQDRIKQMLLQAGWRQWQVDNVSPEDMARIGAYTRLVAEDCARVCESEPERQRGDGVYASDQVACAQAIRARYAETKEG